MTYSNPILDIASAIHSACLRDLPDIMAPRFTMANIREKTPVDEVPKEARRPEIHNISSVELWQQTWGSTSIGFGGMGGAAITTANVVVVMNSQAAAVYFGGRFAYLADPRNQQFRQDCKNRELADVADAKSYLSPAS